MHFNGVTPHAQRHQTPLTPYQGTVGKSYFHVWICHDAGWEREGTTRVSCHIRPFIWAVRLATGTGIFVSHVMTEVNPRFPGCQSTVPFVDHACQ